MRDVMTFGVWWILAGCVTPDAPLDAPIDAAVDALIADASPVRDRAVPDQAVRDQGVSDQALPDIPDLALLDIPDLAQPDIPDLAQPDIPDRAVIDAVVDQFVPDDAVPDMMPDGDIDAAIEMGPGPCVPTGPEACNDLDDDCDTLIDEGIGEICGAPGVCGAGTFECQPDGALVCSALSRREAESCNGLDDDCDHLIDEGFQVGEACEAPGICGAGEWRCGADGGAICSALDAVEDEACNQVDDDCDGAVDEGCPVCPPRADAIVGTTPPMSRSVEALIEPDGVLVYNDSSHSFGAPAALVRFGFDGGEPARTTLHEVSHIDAVVRVDAEYFVFGERRHGQARALTMQRLGLDLRRRGEAVEVLRVQCAETEELTAHAVRVDGGILLLGQDMCTEPRQFLNTRRVALDGRLLEQRVIGWHPFLLFGPVGDVTVVRHAMGLDVFWPGAEGEGGLRRYQLSADGRYIAWEPLFEPDTQLAQTPIQAGPAALYRKRFTNTGYEAPRLQLADGRSVTTRWESAQLRHDGRRQEGAFLFPDGAGLGVIWVDNPLMLQRFDASGAPLTHPQPLLMTDDTVLGANRVADDLVVVLQRPDRSVVVRRLPSSVCSGEWPAHCDALPNAPCRADFSQTCPTGIAWSRPGGPASVFAGELPTWRAPAETPGVLDACHRLVEGYGAVGGLALTYDAHGNLIERRDAWSEVDSGEILSIQHTYDMRGLRVRTDGFYRCYGFAECEFPEVFEIRRYENDAAGRLIRETLESRSAWAAADGVIDRVSVFTWDDDAGIVVEDIDTDADGDFDVRVEHPQ